MLEELSKKNDKWLAMAYKICKDRSVAKDMVQEMYLNIFKSGKNIDEINNSYVYVVIKNCFNHYINTESRTHNISEDFIVVDETNNIEEEIIQKEMQNMAIDHFNALTPYQRGELEMRYYKDMKYKDIAEAKGIPLTNVCQVIRRASIKLKSQNNNLRDNKALVNSFHRVETKEIS